MVSPTTKESGSGVVQIVEFWREVGATTEGGYEAFPGLGLGEVVTQFRH